MRAIKKYILLAFLLENIAVQTSLLGAFTNPLFFLFIGLGAVYLFDPIIWSSTNIKKFRWMYILMGIYIIYAFGVGVEYTDQKAVLYLMAKLSTFSIIITSLTYNEKFYHEKAIWYLIIVMGFFLVYGMLTGAHVNEASGRMLAGYTNENTAGAMGALLVGMLLYYMRNRKWSKWTYLLIGIGFYGVLAGGSRAGFLMLFLLIFLCYGINFKTAGFIVALFLTGVFILPSIGINTVGLERLYNTYTGEEGTNRDLEREAAMWMIIQKPWTGWGFEAQNQGYALQLTELGSHNGYLETFKMIGVPLGILWFVTVIITSFSYVRYLISKHNGTDLFIALVIMLFVKSMYEGLFVGVHEYATNLFFFALAMVSLQLYNGKYQILKK